MNQPLEQEKKSPDVLAVINNVQRALKAGIPKGQKNSAQGYNFRGIDDLLNTLGPILPDHGLVILPRQLTREVTTHPTKSGGTMFHVTLKVEFSFKSAFDGSTEVVEFYGEGMDTSDKATAKASTAAFKTAMVETLCIPIVGEPDADADSPQVGNSASKSSINKPKFSEVISDEEAAALARARYNE